MKTAVVSGSRGFVGRHLRRRLESDGWFVVGIDLLDGHDCLDFFRADTTRYDAAFHCAAVVGGRTSIDGSPLAVATNLALDAHYMRWLVRSKTRRAFYFSSSAAYPVHLQRSPGRLLQEDDITLGSDTVGVPDQTYGMAKLVGESLVPLVAAEGCALHVARPFSGYGTDQDDAYPFPSYIARALRHDPTFTVWGDGRQTRDFIHIDDIVETVMAAVDKDHRAALNVGTGRAVCFDELARMACAPLGYVPVIEHDLSKPTGPSHRVADVARMAEVFVPRVSLEEGIARALAVKAAA